MSRRIPGVPNGCEQQRRFAADEDDVGDECPTQAEAALLAAILAASAFASITFLQVIWDAVTK